MKTAAEWANAWTREPEMVRLGQISLSISAANLLVEVIAEAMADARRAALEEATRTLVARAQAHSTTVGHELAAGLKENARHWTSIQRETEKCAREVRALLDDAGSNQCDGCRAGKPVDENGYHEMGGPVPGYPDRMMCQRAKYAGRAT